MILYVPLPAAPPAASLKLIPTLFAAPGTVMPADGKSRRSLTLAVTVGSGAPRSISSFEPLLREAAPKAVSVATDPVVTVIVGGGPAAVVRLKKDGAIWPPEFTVKAPVPLPTPPLPPSVPPLLTTTAPEPVADAEGSLAAISFPPLMVVPPLYVFPKSLLRFSVPVFVDARANAMLSFEFGALVVPIIPPKVPVTFPSIVNVDVDPPVLIMPPTLAVEVTLTPATF
jgi:hypothetical protein